MQQQLERKKSISELDGEIETTSDGELNMLRDRIAELEQLLEDRASPQSRDVEGQLRRIEQLNTRILELETELSDSNRKCRDTEEQLREARASLEDAQKVAQRHSLDFKSCQFSQKGTFTSVVKQSHAKIQWDDENLYVDIDEKRKACCPWKHVTGIWVVSQTQKADGYSVEFYIETNYEANLNFLIFSAGMHSDTGIFMEHMHKVRCEKLKEGRPPSMIMSYRAFCMFYIWPRPANSNRLRVAFGWVSVCMDLVFAIMFYMQASSIVYSESGALIDSFQGLWEESWLTFVSSFCFLAFCVKSLYEILDSFRSSFEILVRGTLKLVATGKKGWDRVNEVVSKSGLWNKKYK